MKGIFRLYVSRKGFGWALFFMVVTFVLVYCGVRDKDTFVLVLSLVSGIVGLYFTKKSWVSYRPNKRLLKKK